MLLHRWVETTQVHQTSDEFVLTPIGGRFPVPQTNISIEFAPGAIGKTTHFSLKVQKNVQIMIAAWFMIKFSSGNHYLWSFFTLAEGFMDVPLVSNKSHMKDKIFL